MSKNLKKACEVVRDKIEENAFKSVDGYYLDTNSAVCKRVFKNWNAQMRELDDWQCNAIYLDRYDTNLRKRIANYKSVDDLKHQ